MAVLAAAGKLSGRAPQYHEFLFTGIHHAVEHAETLAQLVEQLVLVDLCSSGRQSCGDYGR